MGHHDREFLRPRPSLLQALSGVTGHLGLLHRALRSLQAKSLIWSLSCCHRFFGKNFGNFALLFGQLWAPILAIEPGKFPSRRLGRDYIITTLLTT